jgi:hypothetical protein
MLAFAAIGAPIYLSCAEFKFSITKTKESCPTNIANDKRNTKQTQQWLTQGRNKRTTSPCD